MKKCIIQLTITLWIVSGKLTSQKLLSVLYENWDNSQWNKTTLMTYSYNASQQFTCAAFQSWNAINSSWANGSVTNYTLDLNGNPVLSIQDSWDVNSNTWNRAAKIERTYMLPNSLLTQTNSSWVNNSWQNINRYTSNYDGAGALIETYYDTWNKGNSSWEKAGRTSYTNNANGDPVNILFCSWNNISSAWTNMSLLSMTYTPKNKISYAVNQMWVNNAWQNYRSTTYSYNAGEQMISSVGKNWDVQNATFITETREDHTYHASGHIDQITQLYWENSQSSWYFISRRTYNYDYLPTALAENIQKNFIVYPNPSSSSITLYSASPTTEVILMDVFGRTVKKIVVQTGENIIDIRELPNGIYVLSGSGLSRRIVKQ